MRDGERGAALLTVLLIIAIIAVMAGTALEKLRLATRLAGNAAAIEQARAFAYAAETVATVRISDLLAQNPTRVTLAGGWSGRPFGLPLPGGVATARVYDGGNCFNLNGLVTAGEPGIYTVADPARVQFARLMRLLTIPARTAEGIAAAAGDWIDTDTIEQSQGAEDGTYGGLETPYRTANTLMTDPSELRAVAGVTPEIYATLKPWLCTLPIAEPARINVNTLTPEQAPLLAMLLPDTLSIDAAQQALLRRPPQGYANPGAFWQVLALDGITNAEAQPQTDVVSKWFALRVDVTLGSAEVEERALIDARRLPARLVSRQWGEDT